MDYPERHFMEEALGRHSDAYGLSFESFLAGELRAYLSYTRSKIPLAFWRSTHQHEVDFVLGDKVAIEVKATSRISERNLAGLRALAEEKIVKTFYLVSQDPIERLYPLGSGAKAHVVHWKTFLPALWQGDVL